MSKDSHPSSSLSKHFPRLRIDQYVSLLLIAGCAIVQTGFNGVQQIDLSLSAQSKQKEEQALPKLIQANDIPIFVSANDPTATTELATMSANAVYVMDRASGAILYQKNATAPQYPASTQKMMTALVARRIYPLDRVLEVKQEAFAIGSDAHLKLGEKLTVDQLLAALLIPSGNDAAFVLANNHPLGYGGFIADMNAQAQRLHLTNTTFKNASGLDVEKQVSTARDLAILANEVMKDSVLRQIVGTKQFTIHDVTGKITTPLASTDELLGLVDGVVGIKTGTTDLAGQNLVSEVDRNGHQIIVVVLGSQDRFTETQQIIEWTFRNYEWRKP